MTWPGQPSHWEVLLPQEQGRTDSADPVVVGLQVMAFKSPATLKSPSP